MISALLLPALAIAGPLTVRDPNFYAVLEPNTKLECRHLADPSFGYLFERGAGKEVRVSLITKDVNEGEKSAFTVEFLERDLTGVHFSRHTREGDIGSEVEVLIATRSTAELGYRIRGAVYMATRFFKRSENGEEASDLYLDGSHKLGCKPPPRRP